MADKFAKIVVEMVCDTGQFESIFSIPYDSYQFQRLFNVQDGMLSKG